MTMEAWWALGIGGAVVAAVIGFLIGRMSGGPKKKVEALQSELARAREENSRYRKEVDAHFDKTATLFVSMAGSYKTLFEHLSSGYEKLSDGSARDLFRERVGALLPGSAAGQATMDAATGDGEHPGEATPTADATEAASASVGEDEALDPGEQAAPAMPDGEPVVDPAPLEAPLLPEAERREPGRAEPGEQMRA